MATERYKSNTLLNYKCKHNKKVRNATFKKVQQNPIISHHPCCLASKDKFPLTTLLNMTISYDDEKKKSVTMIYNEIQNIERTLFNNRGNTSFDNQPWKQSLQDLYTQITPMIHSADDSLLLEPEHYKCSLCIERNKEPKFIRWVQKQESSIFIDEELVPPAHVPITLDNVTNDLEIINIE